MKSDVSDLSGWYQPDVTFEMVVGNRRKTIDVFWDKEHFKSEVLFVLQGQAVSLDVDLSMLRAAHAAAIVRAYMAGRKESQ